MSGLDSHFPTPTQNNTLYQQQEEKTTEDPKPSEPKVEEAVPEKMDSSHLEKKRGLELHQELDKQKVESLFHQTEVTHKDKKQKEKNVTVTTTMTSSSLAGRVKLPSSSNLENSLLYTKIETWINEKRIDTSQLAPGQTLKISRRNPPKWIKSEVTLDRSIVIVRNRHTGELQVMLKKHSKDLQGMPAHEEKYFKIASSKKIGTDTDQSLVIAKPKTGEEAEHAREKQVAELLKNDAHPNLLNAVAQEGEKIYFPYANLGGADDAIGFDWKQNTSTLRLDPPVAGHIAAQIVSGMAHLHRLEIAHTDVKSNNVVLHRQNADPQHIDRNLNHNPKEIVAKIIDFGSSAIKADMMANESDSIEVRGKHGLHAPEMAAAGLRQLEILDHVADDLNWSPEDNNIIGYKNFDDFESMTSLQGGENKYKNMMDFYKANDVYQTGILLFNLYMGRLPAFANDLVNSDDSLINNCFTHKDSQTKYSNDFKTFLKNEEIPQEIREMVNSMLDPNPQKRPTMDEVNSLFQHYLMV